MKEKSYIGLFAIISPEGAVSALEYEGEARRLFRKNGEWLDRFLASESERDNFSGLRIAVIDEFVEVYDKAQRAGKKLVDEDANAYLRDMEF